MISGWTAFSRVAAIDGAYDCFAAKFGALFSASDADYVHVDSSATSMEGYAGGLR